jgi:hypothetical protein
MRPSNLLGAVALLAALGFYSNAFATILLTSFTAPSLNGDGGGGKDDGGKDDKDKWNCDKNKEQSTLEDFCKELGLGFDDKDDEDCKSSDEDKDDEDDNDKDCKKDKDKDDGEKDCKKDKDKDNDCKCKKNGKKCKECDKKEKKDKKDKEDCKKCLYKIKRSNVGCGCKGAELHVSMNKQACCVSVKITAKQPVLESYVFIGDTLLEDPIEIPIPPFFEGCFLRIAYSSRVNFPTGPTGCIAVPDYPALVGRVFELQGVAAFAPLAVDPDFTEQFLAMTQVVRVEFK